MQNVHIKHTARRIQFTYTYTQTFSVAGRISNKCMIKLQKISIRMSVLVVYTQHKNDVWLLLCLVTLVHRNNLKYSLAQRTSKWNCSFISTTIWNWKNVFEALQWFDFGLFMHTYYLYAYKFGTFLWHLSWSDIISTIET